MDFSKLMEQAQKLQRDMERQEEELKSREYHSTIRKDIVEVTMNGDYEITEIKLNDDIVNDFTSDDREIVEDAILLAVNDVIRQVKGDKNDMFGSLAGSIDLPGLR